jgi:hypothetical protein
MRKLTSLTMPSIWLIVLLFFFSCRKEWSSNAKNTAISETVNAFLDRQKSPLQPNKAANIDLLKNNLDFSAISYEQYSEGNELMIIPVKHAFTTKKNIDGNTGVYVVFINDKSGAIRNARLAFYVPPSGKAATKLAAKTFANVLNMKPAGVDGMFRFASVTGQWLHQFEYKGGKFYSYGQVQQKKDQKEAARMESMTCTEWWLVTTYYVDGVQVYQTEQYLGTTCTCDNPDMMGLCPDGGGGGGGGGGGDTNTENDDYDATVEEDDGTDSGAPADPGNGGTGDPNGPVGVLDPGNGSGGTYGRAPKIRYKYFAHIVKVNGIVTTAIAYPTTIANPVEWYTDRYGRPTTRTTNVFGTFQTATIGGPVSLCFWSCQVWGNWVYADGVSQPYTRVWSNTHSAVK